MSQATIPDLPFQGTPPNTVLFEISNSGVSESTDLTSIVFGLQEVSEKDQPLGYPGLDTGGKIDINQIPDISGTYQILTEKDIANGYAGLDATGLLLLGTIPQLPQTRITDLVTDLAARELLANKVITVGTPGTDTNYPSEKAVRDALDLKQDTLLFTPEDIANKVIIVGTPGNDTNYPSEKAVRDALNLKEDSLGFTPENIINKVTTVGTPGDDTNYPSEQAVREALDLKEDSLGFTPENIANKTIDLISPDNTKYPTTLAISTELGLYQLLSGKGAVSGYAGLDASQELLLANFPTGAALQVLRRNAGNTALEFADPSGGGGSQTPWTSNIDGAGFALLDVNYLEVGSSLSTPFADAGTIRLPAEGIIAWRNDADDANLQLYSTSDELTIEGWETIVIPTANVAVDLGNAELTGIETLELNGGGSMDLGDTPMFSMISMQFTASNLDHAIAMGNLEIISWEKTGSVGYGSIGSNASDQVVIGFSATNPGAVVNEYTFTETTADWNGNILTNVLAYETNAAFPATGGAVRLGDTEVIAWRNFANDDNFTIGNNDVSFEFAGFEDLAGGDFTTIDFSGATMDLDSLNMGGIIAMTGNQITGVSFLETGAGTPADGGVFRLGNGEQIAWRNFGDSANATLTFSTSDQFLFSSALNVSNNLIKSVLAPVDGTDAANKTYVDNLVNGLAWKESAIVATTGNITLSGEQTIDTVLTSTSRVLVKDQTLGEENGVYVSAAGAWARSTDADTDVELVNMSIFIEQGTVNDGTAWTQTVGLPITVGTTPLVYAQVGAGPVNPLTTKGDIFGYDTESTRIPVGTDDQILVANSAVALGVEWQDIPFPLIAKGDLFTYTTVNARLPVGITGQILSANAATGTGLEWINNDASPLTSKGDIYTFTTVNERLAVGSNDQYLIADATEPTGLKWETLPAFGDVDGPGSSTTNALALFTDTTGKLIKNSSVTFNASNQFTIPGPIILSATGTVPAGTNTYIRKDTAASPDSLDINVGSSEQIQMQFGGGGVPFIFTSGAAAFGGAGGTISNADYEGELTNVTVTVASGLGAGITYGNGIKQTFNPSGSNAGLNVGQEDLATNPAAPVNGDIYYNSNAGANKFRAYENGSWVDLISVGGSGDVTGPGSSTDNAIAIFNLTTGKIIQQSGATAQPLLIDDNANLSGIRSLQPVASNSFPAASVAYFQYGNNGQGSLDFEMNVLTGNKFRWTIQGTQEYDFTATEANFRTNNIVQLGAYHQMDAIASPGNSGNAVRGRIFMDSGNLNHLTIRRNDGIDVDLEASGAGDVTGPGSSTDNEIAIYDSTTGKIIQNNGSGAQPVTISDLSYIAGIRALTFSGFNTTQGTGLHWIQFANSNLHFNVSTGGYKFDTAGTTLLQLTTNVAQFNDLDLILDDNFIQTTESAGDPGSPGAAANRLYTKDVAGRSHLFIQDDVGAVDIQSGGGDVSGPASSLNHSLAVFDGVTGKIIDEAGSAGFEIIVDVAGQPTLPRNLIFTSFAVAPPGGTVGFIGNYSNTMTINGNSGIALHIQNVPKVNLTATDVLLADLNVRLGTGFAEFEEIAKPAIPAADSGRLYAKEVATETHLFFLNSSDEETDLTLGTEITTWTEDHIASRFNLEATGAIQFDLLGPLVNPAVSLPYIAYDTVLSPDGLTINVPLARLINFAIGGVSEFEFRNSQVDVKGNNVVNAGLFRTAAANTSQSGGVQLGNNEFLTWRNAANSGDHDVRFNASDEFIISVNSGTDYAFSETRFNMGNNYIDALARIEFNTSGTQPASTINSIWATSDNLNLQTAVADEINLYVGNILEYQFSNSIFDGLGNILRNFSQADIQSTTTPIVQINNTDSTPAAAQSLGFLRFRGDRTASSAIEYAEFETIMVDPSAGSADGELIIKVVNANALTEYITLNEGGAQTIHFKKNLQDFTLDPTTGTAEIVGIEGLRFTDDATILTGTLNFIQKHTDNLILNVETGDGFLMTINGTTAFGFSATELDIVGKDINNIQNVVHDLSTSGTDVDFTEDQLQEISISANTTFTGTGYAIGKSKTLKITTDGTLRTLAFPAGWVFVGAKPTDQAASKEGILTLTCFTAAEAGVVAAYSVEA